MFHSTEDVCRTYYETQVFGPGGAGDVSPAAFANAARIYLEAHDVSLKGIDVNTYSNEIIAANIELFGLAWLDHHREYNDLPNAIIPEEIGFTKRFLRDTGRVDIWERMGVYNEALAKAVVELKVGPQFGRLWDVPNMITGDDLVVELSKLAKVLADSFSKDTTDRECVDRLVFRFLAMPCDIPTVTALSQRLSLVLAGRMGLKLEPSGLFGIQTMIVGLHENAVGYLEAIRDYGSYEAAKSSASALIEHLIDWAVTCKKPGDSNRDFR